MSGFIRFDEAILGAIRGAVDLPALIGQDLELRRAGPDSFKACCPFHAESTPSFFVKRNGFYRCYGCEKTGDAIEWLRQRHGLSFHEAACQLARTHRIALPPPPDLSEEAREQVRHNAQLRRVLEEASRIFRRGLARRPGAHRYLTTERGLDEAAISTFELGVVGSGVAPLLSRYPRGLLVEAGLALLDDGEVVDRFTHRIMVPIRNQSGALVSFAGRLYLPGDRRESKYLNGPETAIFRKGDELFGANLAQRAIRRERTAIVVEGYFDVIALHGIGEYRAVAPMGTALAANQVERLLLMADHVYFAFDGDAAGRRAAISAAHAALQHIRDGQSAHFVNLPGECDPDTLVRAGGAEAWTGALEAAAPLSAVAIGQVLGGLDVRVVEMRVTAAQRARELLQHIRHAPLYRRSFQQALEEAVGMPLE